MLLILLNAAGMALAHWMQPAWFASTLEVRMRVRMRACVHACARARAYVPRMPVRLPAWPREGWQALIAPLYPRNGRNS